MRLMADWQCNQEKTDQRQYKALVATGRFTDTGSRPRGALTDSLVNPSQESRIEHLPGKIFTKVASEYKVVAESYAALFQANATPLKTAIKYDASGNLHGSEVTAGLRVWTGLGGGGDVGSHCNNWSSNSASDSANWGRPEGTNGYWHTNVLGYGLDLGQLTCNSSARLYCISID